MLDLRVGMCHFSPKKGTTDFEMLCNNGADITRIIGASLNSQLPDGLTIGEVISISEAFVFWWINEEIKASAMFYHLGSIKHQSYLRHPVWRAKREVVIIRTGGRCSTCGIQERGLHVHHNTYSNKPLEKPGDLVCLCGPCHEMIHAGIKRTLRITGPAPLVLEMERKAR